MPTTTEGFRDLNHRAQPQPDGEPTGNNAHPWVTGDGRNHTFEKQTTASRLRTGVT